MARSDFLRELNGVSQSIHELLAAKTNAWLNDVIAGGPDKATGKTMTPDRIYELFCYFFIVKAVGDRQALYFKPGTGRTGYRLPKSPGNKQNFAFFRFEVNGHVFDLCNGTAVPIPDAPNEPAEHPDISLQLVDRIDALSEPGIVCGIWDAKFHDGRASTKDEIWQMRAWMQLLEVTNNSTLPILPECLPEPFQVSGIITNATSVPPHRKSLLDNQFSFIFNFSGDLSTCFQEPSLGQHLARLAETTAR